MQFVFVSHRVAIYPKEPPHNAFHQRALYPSMALFDRDVHTKKKQNPHTAHIECKALLPLIIGAEVFNGCSKSRHLLNAHSTLSIISSLRNIGVEVLLSTERLFDDRNSDFDVKPRNGFGVWYFFEIEQKL